MRHHHQSLAIAFQLVLGVLIWQTSGLTCIVSEANETLEACFRSSATDIVLRGDHSVGQTFAQYATAPLELQRNVTLRGPAGTQADDRPVLDFGLVDGAVELCSSCMISIQDLVLKQERRGSGPTYDFFTGQPGSRIRSIRTYRIRAGCTPAPVQIRALEALKRSSLFPNSTSSQHVELRNVSYKGKVYIYSVWSVDITFDVARRVDEGPSGSEGGYAQMSQNSVRLCEAYVSLDCLAVKSADTCVSQLREGLPTAQQPAGLGRNAAVAIIVPLVIGFMLAAGLVGWWAKRRCIGKSPDPVPVALKSYKSRRSFNRTASRCTTSGDDSESSSTFGSSAGPCLGKPLASNAGWELLDSKTSPLLGRVDDSTVDLGALIGSGSFGKVFKGQWNGMDVAVKVIEHSGTSAAAVQHELELMMTLQHPNIVRAYHCLTYVHTDCLETECSISTTASLRNSSFVSPSGTSFNQRLMHSSGSFTAARLANSSTASMHTAAAAAAGATAPATANATGTLGCPCLCKSSVSPCAPTCEDAVLTITADAAYGRQQPCHCCQSSSTAAPAAQEAQVQGSRQSQEASPFAPMAGSTGAGVNMGSGSSRQTQAGVTDSMGSSVDCRCTAGELRTSKSFKEPSKRFESWLVLEYCDCGNLSSYLANWPPPCSSRCESTMLRLLQLLQDTANGLQELHHQQVVHGDLNARNVLVASSSEASIGVQGKLADLGLSRSVTQYKTHRTTNTVGTMSHTAPEMLRLGYMSVAADVYALGIMMWELYTGEDAFQRLQHPGQFFETVVLQDLRPVIPHGMPADYQLLMQHCWATEPDARPSISRVLECLQYMITERQQHKARGSMDVQAGGGPGRLAASAPLPLLLQSAPPRKQHWWQLHAMQRLSLMKMLGSETSNSQPGTVPPSQASSGALPSFAAQGGYLDLSPPNSNTLLPVLDVEEASDVQPAATLHQQQQPQQLQQDAARGSGPDVPPGYNSQPLPAFMTNSFSFYRRTGPSRLSADLQCCSREGSNSNKSGTSSGKLPTFLQSLRQGSFSMRDVSFSSSARQGSQTGSIIGDHAWFV